MKAVAAALGLARSHLHNLFHRCASWVDGRTTRTPKGDAELVAEIREQLADLPSYGYRRACALVNRERGKTGRPRVNHKRAHRVMAAHKLLLPKAPKRAKSQRKHEGTVSVQASDTRWCSDGFEIGCDSGETVTVTFVKDCCDREAIAHRGWAGKGLPGEPVREMLIEAVEKRFGAVEAVPEGWLLEFLSDNGGAYIAHDTHAVARSLGLTPIHTPVCSPQSNGMAESFVNTFKRDYVARMDLSDAPTVLLQLPGAFEHFNEVHPHSSLSMKSPREFRRQQIELQRCAQDEKSALNCV
jgi:transposase InsO family protein